MLRDNLEGWEDAREGGDIWIPWLTRVDRRAERNTTWQSNYPPVKNKSVLKKAFFECPAVYRAGG